MADGTLITRFVAGSNTFGDLMPGTPERRFFGEMPREVTEVNQRLAVLQEEMTIARRQQFKAIERAHAAQTMVLREVSGQLDQLAQATASGFSSLERAFDRLEFTMGAELGEMRWILGELDEKFARLLHLVEFPRETEASELVADGAKALATGNLDDAEACLLEAVSRKRTHFQAHTTLGFLYIHKGSAAKAIEHFKKSVDYAPAQALFLATENLARMHFAAGDFVAAQRTMQRSLDLRLQQGKRWLPGEYQLAVYIALAGAHDEAVDRLVALCATEPAFFSTAALDKDLAAVRPQLLGALERELADRRKKSQSASANAERRLAATERHLDAGTKGYLADGLNAIRKRLQEARHSLEAASYAELVSIQSDSESIVAFLDRLTTKGSVFSDFSERREHTESKLKNIENALKDVNEPSFVERTLCSVSVFMFVACLFFFGFGFWCSYGSGWPEWLYSKTAHARHGHEDITLLQLIRVLFLAIGGVMGLVADGLFWILLVILGFDEETLRKKREKRMKELSYTIDVVNDDLVLLLSAVDGWVRGIKECLNK